MGGWDYGTAEKTTAEKTTAEETTAEETTAEKTTAEENNGSQFYVTLPLYFIFHIWKRLGKCYTISN